MKRIALICSVPISALNGLSKVVKSFYDNQLILLQNGIEIDFYAPDVNNNKLSIIESSKSNKKSLLKKIIHKIDFIGLISQGYNIFFRSKNIINKAINEGMASKQYDAIFVHELYTAYQLFRMIEPREKVYFTLHSTGSMDSMIFTDYPLLRYSLTGRIMISRIKKTVFDNIEKVIFNSKIAAENFKKLYPKYSPELVEYVNNGIKNSPAHIHKIKDNFEIVCVGSVSGRKGQTFIVEAIKDAVIKGITNFHFTIVGDGPLLPNLKKETISSKLEAYITFEGPQQDVTKYLEKSNIFILPSVDEGQPIAIIEAMREGLPIVSSPVGGIPMLVKNGINGILISPSKEGVYKFLTELNYYDWEKMGQQSRYYYETGFTIEKMIAKYCKIFNNEI